MIYLLFVIPGILAFIALVINSSKIRVGLIPLTCITHLILTLYSVFGSGIAQNKWLAIDPINKICLVIISIVFAVNSIYIFQYLNNRHGTTQEQFKNNKVFSFAILMLLTALTLAILSQHLGLMWVAIETATLSVVPLIYYNRRKSAIEATWKYLIIGGVGIALALLGTFILTYSSFGSGEHVSIFYPDMLINAKSFTSVWVKIGFVFLLVGYGTKMGLAPMHTWKPDTYSEGSGLVGSLLAGAVTTTAFLAVLRVTHITIAAGEVEYAKKILLLIGMLSIAVASIYMLQQKNLKRLFAYSSVEHMGILALGIGAGKGAMWAVFLHVIGNAFSKGAIFLSVGNMSRAVGKHKFENMTGGLRITPFSAIALILGMLAVTGSPPFSIFLSEFLILKALFTPKLIMWGVAFIFFMLIVFIGIGKTVFASVFGNLNNISQEEILEKENILNTIPIAIFLLLSACLGCYIPEFLQTMLTDAVQFWGES